MAIGRPSTGWVSSNSIAARLAADAGCMAKEAVNENTTVLVADVGDRDRLADHEKNSKLRQAELVIPEGHLLENPERI